jgi:hypothetical protein
MTRTTDLQSRGETTVLVKRVRSFVTEAEGKNYSEVIDMEEVIEKYHDTYAKDLEERLCLQTSKGQAANSNGYFYPAQSDFWLEAKNCWMWIDE